MLEIEQSFGSNVCRCTGYRPIMDGFKKFAKDSPHKPIQDIEDLHICKESCKSCDKSNCEENGWCVVEKEDGFDFNKVEMKLSDGKFWFRVVKIKNIFKILQEKGDDSYMLVAGNTAKGVYPIEEYPRILIDFNGVTELKGYKMDQNLIIGAAVTLTELMEIFKSMSEQEYFAYLQKFYDHLKKVAHIPVRNLLQLNDKLATQSLGPVKSENQADSRLLTTITWLRRNDRMRRKTISHTSSNDIKF